MPLPKLNPDSVERNIGESRNEENGTTRFPRASATPPGVLLIPAELRAKALEAIEGALTAQRRYWDKDTKAFVEEEDHPTRLRAAELALAYDVGRPVERQVKLTGDVSTYDDKLERLLASPEGLALAIRLGLIDEKPLKSAKAKGKAGKTEASEDEK